MGFLVVTDDGLVACETPATAGKVLADNVGVRLGRVWFTEGHTPVTGLLKDLFARVATNVEGYTADSTVVLFYSGGWVKAVWDSGGVAYRCTPIGGLNAKTPL